MNIYFGQRPSRTPRRLLCSAVFWAAVALAVTPAFAAVPAFPGAEGYGANATGGRGGVVLAVTRLDDPDPTEPGTLRWALSNDHGPRTIVFRVGGVIKMRPEEVRPFASNVTIAGQTAPGDGICIEGKLDIGSNAIVRHLRVRGGETGVGDNICIWNDNVIIDHCSVSWSSDEGVAFHRAGSPPDRKSTIQWCIISEQRKGSIASYGNHRVTYHHNLWAHNYERNPRLGDTSQERAPWEQYFDVRNNVAYDLGNTGTLVAAGHARVNMVGNYFKLGSERRKHRYSLGVVNVYVSMYDDPDGGDAKIYFADHYGPWVADGEPLWNETYDQIDMVRPIPEERYRAYTPFAAPPVTTHDPQTAYDLVLGNAGAMLPKRDSVDERIISQVRDGTGKGTYPGSDAAVRARAIEQWATLSYQNGTPPDDTDSDGMPDSWETARDLNPSDPSDSSGYDLDPNYTNIEVYINSLSPSVPGGNLQPSANAGPDQTLKTDDLTGADVQLDGSGSSDPDGDPLTYQWTWLDANGTQQSASGVTPTVRLPVGENTVTLVVNDGSLLSVPDTVIITINTDNRPPGAPDVGITPDQPNTTNQLTVTAQSTDPDGDDVTYSYAWYKDDVLQDGLTSSTVSADLTSRGEIWHVIVTPSDGQLDGEVGQASTTIVNAPPTKASVSISPTSPKTEDDLVATADGSTDPDGDNVTYSYAWYKDTGDQPPSPIVSGSTVSSDLTAGGETWRVVAVPSDGENTGESGEAVVVIDTVGPTQPTVSIGPTDPTTTDALVANASGSTTSNGATVTYSYEWYMDGALQSDLTDATVPADRTAKDQLWHVVVTPDDGAVTGPSAEASATVLNSAPSAPSLALAPTSPRTTDSILVTAEGSSDADGDAITYEYTWYKDDAVQSSLSGGTVAPEHTAKEQTWRVVVVATDGSDNSIAADASVTVVNSAPTQPAVAISPSTPSASDSLTASTDSSVDPDGDTVTLSYAWYRNDSLQDTLTGNTVPSESTSAGDTWRVVVTPTDGEATGDPGEATATIDNSAPTEPTVSLSPEAPATDDDIVATAGGSTDPDGDAITYKYTWQKNGTVQADLTGATVPAELTAKGDTWQVAVTATDGRSTGPTATASVDVVNTPPTAPTVAIDPDTPRPVDDLVAQATGSEDINGDTVSYRYAWYRDGVLEQDLTSATVSSEVTAAGETWRVAVAPTDGTDQGPTAEATVTIQQTYSVAGTVLDHSGNPVSGVEVSDGTRSAITDADGHYTIGGFLGDTTVTLTASLPDHLITPNTIRATVPPSVRDADFTVHKVFTRTVSAGVQMLGSPVETVTTSSSQIWQSSLVARWSPSQGQYTFLSDASGLGAAPGLGYFIRSDGGDLSVAGVPVPTDHPFSLDLESGWNMVANPFLEPLPFANIADNLPDQVQPAGYAYDPSVGYCIVACVQGVNVNRDYIDPWEGIWLYNDGGPTTIMITPPGQSPTAVASSAAADADLDGLVLPASATQRGQGWLIPIHVECAEAADRSALVGMSNSLQAPIEIAAPPAAPQGVSARIISQGGAPLAQNVRTGIGPASWDFVVSTDISGAEVHVRLPDMSTVPDDMVVYLTDVAADRRMYARTMTSYSFAAPDDGGDRRFRIEVAPRSERALAITSMSASHGGGAAGITYSVTADCNVSARVMNIAGRTVRILASDQSVAQGANTLSWNFRGDRGTMVANGMYIVVLEARGPDGQQTRAMSTMSVQR